MAFEIKTGTAKIDVKKPVIAGSYQTVRFTYTAAHPIDDTGCIKIAFRYAGDYGVPQFDNPKAKNYCTVYTNGDCRINARWDPMGHIRPWDKSIYLYVMGGFLNKGENVTVVFGDTSFGSPGWQTQTFVEDSFEFKTLVDCIATFQFRELSESPTMKIIPGTPKRALCIAPSQIKCKKKFNYYIKLEDRWGNPIHKPKKLSHKGFAKPGIHRLEVMDTKTGFHAISNPIIADKTEKSTAPFQLYWADFHGQSEETIGSNSIDNYFLFARDYGLIDICGHQGNDFQVTDDFWEKIKKTSRKFNKSGKFVTFPGYEWSGNTPLGGDRNVYFTNDGGRITRSCNELLPRGKTIYPVSPTADDLFRNLNKQQKEKPFAFAHVGGRFPDLTMHNPQIEVGMEIHSAWGTFEWLMEDALEKGYRIAIVANSDGHKGRPGASYPGASTFGSYGGLTCVMTNGLTRETVYEALKKRHVYATTGNRMLLEVSLETTCGQKAIMGDVIMASNENYCIHVRVATTAPLEKVEVRNGLKTIKTIRPYGKSEVGRRIKIAWSGAEVRGRARKTVWDGSLTIKGNSIIAVKPVNFWNAFQPLRMINKKQLEWESITTGGIAGCIVELTKPLNGALQIETKQTKALYKIGAIGLNPKIKKLGGLCKKLEIYRLPDRNDCMEMEFNVPIKNLKKGDNPIYVRVMQEDGHIAWSSAIYIVKE